MKEFIDEMVALDDYKKMTIGEITEFTQNEDVSLVKPAQMYLLRAMGIPASYYNNASEELKRRMFIEGRAGRKDEILRVAQREDEIVGIGPNLDKEISMKGYFENLEGSPAVVSGSLINSGPVYIFMKLGELNITDEKILYGYNIVLSPMFNSGIKYRPALLVVICTNGMVDNKVSGSTFNIKPGDIGSDLLTMTGSAIVGVVNDMKASYTDSVTTAMGATIESATLFIEQQFEAGTVSKTLMSKALKIVEFLMAGGTSDDPAHPKSYKTLWDIIQILTFSARSFGSPTGRVSAEAGIMRILQN